MRIISITILFLLQYNLAGQVMMSDDDYRAYLEKIQYSHNIDEKELLNHINQLNKSGTLLHKGFVSEIQAYLFQNKRDLNAAIQSYKDALAYYDACGETIRLSGVYGAMIFLLKYNVRIGEGMDYAIKAVEFVRRVKDSLGLIEHLTSLGEFQYRMKQYNKAKTVLIEALEISKKFPEVECETHLILADALTDLGKSDSALVIIQQGLAKAIKNNTPKRIHVCKIAMARVFTHMQRYEDAEKLVKEVIRKIHKTDFTSSLPSAFYLLGSIYRKQSKYAESLIFLDSALLRMANRKNWKQKVNIHYEKSICLSALGNHKKALESIKLWKQAQDSASATENAVLFADASSRYNSYKLEKEIGDKVTALKTSNLRIKWLFALLMLSIIGVFTIYQLYKMRNQKISHEAEIIKIEAKRIKELDQIKSAFFTNVSHEFRTPLTLIIEPLKSLDRDLLEGKYKNSIKRMKYAADYMLKLINELLDLARIESGSRHLKLQDEELNSFLKKIVYSIQSLADLRNITLKVNLPDETIFVSFDKACIETIVINLLTNAIKYSPEFRTVAFEMEIYEADDECYKLGICISDNGYGIPKSDLPHIFDKFYRVENNHESETIGSGIGLAIIKEMVELHKGQIDVWSEEGQGSIFKITITLQKCEPIVYENYVLKDKMPDHLENIQSMSHEISAQKILIADDNEQMAKHIASCISTAEQIFIAKNGAEAFEIAQKEIPDLIITDLIMPVMDGMDFISNLRYSPITNHIPVVLLTGNTQLENKIEGWKRGSDAYLNKPFAEEELQSLIHNLLNQRRKLQEKYQVSIEEGRTDDLSDIHENEFFKQVVEVLNNHFDDESFSVEIMANDLNMSRSNLFRKVIAITGMNPTILIRNFRLQKAMEMLKAGKLPKEVCFMCGFNSFSYFSKCFGEKYGIVPSKVQ